MDALKMLKAAKRYCKSVNSCCDCELGEKCVFETAPAYMDIERMAFTVSFLEAWERENPGKTRGELFLERNPDAGKGGLGLPLVRPCDYLVDKLTIAQCEACDNCDECVTKFWKESVE